MKNLINISIFLFLVGIISFGCKKTKTTIKPTANFSFDGTSKKAPTYVQFTNTSVDAVAYNWDFGDGTNSTEQNPKHQYKNVGAYNISLTAKSQNGEINILLHLLYSN